MNDFWDSILVFIAASAFILIIYLVGRHVGEIKTKGEIVCPQGYSSYDYNQDLDSYTFYCKTGGIEIK